jgi:hypothetical protein
VVSLRDNLADAADEEPYDDGRDDEYGSFPSRAAR